MIMKKRVKLGVFFVVVGFTFSACSKEDSPPVDERTFGIFTVQDDGVTVLANGDIRTRTLADFNKMIEAFPNIGQIHIKEMPGSLDDETNVQIGRLIYGRNIDTHLLDGGLIASGGVDFYLAGKARTLGNEVMVGVHSWSDGNKEATDFPENAPEHDLFIDYYKAIGFGDQLARDFYFFTINAAAADDIHYMSSSEIEKFQLER